MRRLSRLHGALLQYVVCCLPLLLAACSTPLPLGESRPAVRSGTVATTVAKAYPALPAAGSGRGAYYKDDGPGDNIPADLQAIPDAEPRVEPYAKGASRPYTVFGKTYTPINDDQPFKQRGIGSWYGKKFHGQKTASGELYDMYKMTAAHPTLPLPSYARVTNLKTGMQVIVRINDRGPFHSDRIIDLSYTAALKLGYLGSGSSELEVERLLPDDIVRMEADARAGRAAQSAVTSHLAQAETVAQPALVAGSNLTPLSGSYYLQFGAYAQEANALSARATLWPSLAGVVTELNAVPVNGLYRLYAGPYVSRVAAQAAAQLVRDRSALTPFVVESK